MDTLFFIAAKLVGALLRLETWLLLGLAGTLWFVARRRPRAALRLGGALFALLVAITVFPLGAPLVQRIERSFPAHPPLTRVDGIIVLGGAEDAASTAAWQQVQLNDAAERFTAALALARRFPDARVLFTGGSGRLRDLGGTANNEAGVAERFFTEQGIVAPRLLLEGASRNTAENARLSREVAQPQPGETWVLVTTAYHMPRAMRSFVAAGWTGLVPYPVDYRTGRFADGMGWDLAGHLQLLNVAIRETVGQLAYRFTGR